MTPYFVLLAVIALLGVPLCEPKAAAVRGGVRLYLGVMTVALTAISGLRYLVGYDYASYWPGFATSYFSDWKQLGASKTEKGYVIISKLLTNLSIEPYVLFTFFGLLFTLGVVWFTRRYSSCAWLSLFAFASLGVMFNSFCFVRQYAALMCVMFAWPELEANRPLRWFAYVLLGSCFHISALVALPLFWPLRLRLRTWLLGVYFVVGSLCYAYSYEIITFVTKFYYKKYVFAPKSELVLTIRFGTVVGLLVLLTLCIIFYEPLIQRSKISVIAVNCLLLATFFSLLGTKHAIISRLALLFETPALLILVPELVGVLSELWRDSHLWNKRDLYLPRIGVCVVAVGLMSVFCWYLLSVNYNGVVPYRTVMSAGMLV